MVEGSWSVQIAAKDCSYFLIGRWRQKFSRVRSPECGVNQGYFWRKKAPALAHRGLAVDL